MPASFLTIAEVATELNISINQVRTLIRTGSLPVGRNRQGHRLIEQQMLERWIEDQYAKSRRWVLEHRHDGYHGDWKDWPNGRGDHDGRGPTRG